MYGTTTQNTGADAYYSIFQADVENYGNMTDLALKNPIEGGSCFYVTDPNLGQINFPKVTDGNVIYSSLNPQSNTYSSGQVCDCSDGPCEFEEQNITDGGYPDGIGAPGNPNIWFFITHTCATC